jgi:Holliday junction resolvase
MKEQDYQRKIIKYLESRGAYIVKVISASKSGVPDIIACYKSYFLGLEVKTPKTCKNTSKLQDYNLEQIRKSGGIAHVVVEVDEIETILKDIDYAISNSSKA